MTDTESLVLLGEPVVLLLCLFFSNIYHTMHFPAWLASCTLFARATPEYLVVHGKNDGDGAAAAISESHPPHAIFMSPPIAAVFSAADAPPGDGTRASRPTRRGGRQALVRQRPVASLPALAGAHGRRVRVRRLGAAQGVAAATGEDERRRGSGRLGDGDGGGVEQLGLGFGWRRQGG
uniref:Uncharacterized protein n=1 Tax=Aegilops tauschii subsp. strangulata TaxID=200361 RepID=A0A452ZX95_AEGTS